MVLAGSLLLVVCINTVGGASPQEPTPEPRDPYEVLSEVLEKPYEVRIKDEWDGYGPIAPISSLWELKTFHGLAGTVIFRAQPDFPMLRWSPARPDLQGPGSSGKVFFKTADIAVPEENAKNFLKRLSQVHLVRGEYVPSIPRTDNYPSITIEIETSGVLVSRETITFFTQSQGKGHVPWGVTIQGVTYVVPSDIPARALEELDPYLRRNILENLLSTLRNSEPLPPKPPDRTATP